MQSGFFVIDFPKGYKMIKSNDWIGLNIDLDKIRHLGSMSEGILPSSNPF